MNLPKHSSHGCFNIILLLMPNYTSPPGTIIQELLKKTTPESLLDCQFSFEQQGLENPPTSLLFGPDYMETKMYKCCQPEDVMLAQLLVRPAKLFIEDLMNDTLLTKDKYGSVKRVFVVCDEDEVMDEDFQKWIIKNSSNHVPVEEVKVIKGADHMVMFSKPHELSLYLQEITKRFVH
ncbi:Methylesterase [Thalictrum thalictroides]|uniref:Methylesterase n=1 Tax=Thalictrum thalictroides TaxID=46969 RepID=A0A7J6WCG6_THATH|nr:Methylesterase [Thalictrum thalictroides]